MIETVIFASILASILFLIAVLLHTQGKILKELKNIKFPQQQKIEFPPAKEVVLDLNPVVEAVKNIHIPQQQKIEFPPAKEVVLDLNPVIEAINKSVPQRTVELLQNLADTQSTLIKTLQETSTLMRVNEAEFQSGLETFHKAIDKLLAQIPNEEKELNSQKEFMQKFEEAFVKVQETAAEAMNENSLRLQEILTELLNREAK
jgi:valyl-tRNA synthetase